MTQRSASMTMRLCALACFAVASLQLLSLAQVPATGMPMAPKRPMSGFLHFAKENRASYASEHPDAAPKDVVKAMAEQWNELTPEDKAPFLNLYQEAKERYQTDLQMFLEAGGVLPKNKSKKDKKQKRAKPAVKRPLSAYVLYTIAVRPSYVEEHPEAKATEVIKALAKSWKDLDESEKQTFVEQAEEAKAKYIEEVAALKANQE